MVISTSTNFKTGQKVIIKAGSMGKDLDDSMYSFYGRKISEFDDNVKIRAKDFLKGQYDDSLPLVIK